MSNITATGKYDLTLSYNGTRFGQSKPCVTIIDSVLQPFNTLGICHDRLSLREEETVTLEDGLVLNVVINKKVEELAENEVLREFNLWRPSAADWGQKARFV